MWSLLLAQARKRKCGVMAPSQRRTVSAMSVPSSIASSAVMALPMVILFLFTQRYFVQGIALTGMKG